jgi:hypothetical protein
MSINPNKDKKEIRLDASIAFRGMDELQQHLHAPAFFELSYHCDIVMAKQHAVAINKKTGLYWVFSLEKAAIVTSGMIFKKLTPEMILSGGFDGAFCASTPKKRELS